MPLRHRIAAQQDRPRRSRDEGFAMSSPVALMSAAAVAMAGVAFFATDHRGQEPQTVSLASAPDRVEGQVRFRATKVTPTVTRSEIYVSVYNNSNITGLAGRTASRIDSAGWQVVGSDNWYGTIPATTIYYPERLKTAAQMLSKDLGVTRLLPSVDPMSMDRLTLILTADFA